MISSISRMTATQRSDIDAALINLVSSMPANKSDDRYHASNITSQTIADMPDNATMQHDDIVDSPADMIDDGVKNRGIISTYHSYAWPGVIFAARLLAICYCCYAAIFADNMPVVDRVSGKSIAFISIAGIAHQFFDIDMLTMVLYLAWVLLVAVRCLVQLVAVRCLLQLAAMRDFVQLAAMRDFVQLVAMRDFVQLAAMRDFVQLVAEQLAYVLNWVLMAIVQAAIFAVMYMAMAVLCLVNVAVDCLVNVAVDCLVYVFKPKTPTESPPESPRDKDFPCSEGKDTDVFFWLILGLIFIPLLNKKKPNRCPPL